MTYIYHVLWTTDQKSETIVSWEVSYIYIYMYIKLAFPPGSLLLSTPFSARCWTCSSSHRWRCGGRSSNLKEDRGKYDSWMHGVLPTGSWADHLYSKLSAQIQTFDLHFFRFESYWAFKRLTLVDQKTRVSSYAQTRMTIAADDVLYECFTFSVWS